MLVIDRSIYRGPHLYSATPMIRFTLDLGALEQSPTRDLPGFTGRLLEAVPSLASHGCSRGHPGGFVERLREGTWIGHVVEHVALELQELAGARATRGKTRSVPGRPGVYNVMFAYQDEVSGLMAGRMALELVDSLLPPEHAGVEGLNVLAPPIDRSDSDGAVPGLAALTRRVRRTALGPTTQGLADAARRRGIPVERVDENSLLRLGHGAGQKMLRASISGNTPHLAVSTASDKALTKRMLDGAGVPVPRGSVVATAEEAVEAAARIHGPVVVKPLDGNHGRGITVGALNADAVSRGFEVAIGHSRRVIVEEQFTGRDYRILVIGGRVVAVSERIPAHIVGDGVHSVAELVRVTNADPRRGRGHENVMTELRIDRALTELLERNGMDLDSVPAAGQMVILRDTANLSTGGEAIDRTDEIHPANRAMAERAARVIGLDIAGLDVLAPDISQPLSETGGGVIEVNAAPGFRMHLHPSYGTPRDVAGPVIDMLFPKPARSRIPITAVTGTNGKSTTVRMISHILQEAGLVVGSTTTTGIYIGDQLLKAADASGPKSARMVLADPTVQAAVLETARGGMLREGLAFDRADIGMVLNISADHLGLKGIDTLQQLAAVKSMVVRQVKRRGTSILNADDPLTRGMKRVAGGRIAYFTMHPRAELDAELQAHLADGGRLATLERSAGGGTLVLHHGDTVIPLLKASDIHATLGGTAGFNTQNALAAALAAHVQGVSPEHIAEALRTFEGSFEQNPGRLNLTRAPGFTAILDYAHNPAALRALGEVVQAMRTHHRRSIGVVSTPGDRRDEDIREMGQIAAGIFDLIVFRERPDGRGRAAGGVLSLLTEGALSAGKPANEIRRIADENEAVDAALRLANPDDLVVVMPTDVHGVWRQLQEFRTRPKRGLTDAETYPSLADEATQEPATVTRDGLYA